ncbi:MAG: DnaJ domain-containing protein [Myxococcaceae bacterium]|nr:DnaJ domain-containing protein [Myxococcaceae bacterium]
MQEAVGGARAEDKELLARHRQQQDLLRQMNEALKRSVAPAPDAAPTPPEANPVRRSDEKTDPNIRVAAPPPSPVPPPSRPSAPRSLVFGRDQQGDDVDLWNMVQPSSPSQTAPGNSNSFEEALRRVDSSLEALVGQQPRPLTTPVEPIIEAEISTTPATPATEDSDLGDPSDPAEAARLRRQRLLRRAMESLGTVPSPSSPSGITSSPSGVTSSPSGITSSPSGVSPSPAPSAPAAPPPSSPSRATSAPPPSSPSRAAAATTPQDAQLAQQIEARFEQLKKKDHFATLGVTQQSSRDQVKTAFLGLAKTFHPDRLPPTLPHLAQKMSAVFEAIREAYETLYDDAKRTAYVATVAAQRAQGQSPTSSTSQASAQQASDLFKMGEVFFKKRDYRQAEDHFGRAHALDKGANSLAAQAWSIYMDPSRKPEGQAARAMMQKALTIDAACDRAHYQLGVIARVEGDMERAEKHFREAVRVNPRHLEASQELRLIEMRRKKESGVKKGGGGLFG